MSIQGFSCVDTRALFETGKSARFANIKSVAERKLAQLNAAPSLGLTLNNKVMLNGFSQGGHAALAAQRAIEQENSGEFNVVAAVHMAGSYAVSQMLIDGVSQPIDLVHGFPRRKTIQHRR